MLACPRYYRWHNRWPPEARSLDDTSKWMDVTPRALAKWRMRRRFVLDDFDGIWYRMFRDYPEDDHPSPPIPLMFATCVIIRMCVVGSWQD